MQTHTLIHKVIKYAFIAYQQCYTEATTRSLALSLYFSTRPFVDLYAIPKDNNQLIFFSFPLQNFVTDP